MLYQGNSIGTFWHGTRTLESFPGGQRGRALSRRGALKSTTDSLWEPSCSAPGVKIEDQGQVMANIPQNFSAWVTGC